LLAALPAVPLSRQGASAPLFPQVARAQELLASSTRALSRSRTTKSGTWMDGTGFFFFFCYYSLFEFYGDFWSVVNILQICVLLFSRFIRVAGFSVIIVCLFVFKTKS
jgi:hypothetical protein